MLSPIIYSQKSGFLGCLSLPGQLNRHALAVDVPIVCNLLDLYLLVAEISRHNYLRCHLTRPRLHLHLLGRQCNQEDESDAFVNMQQRQWNINYIDHY